MCLNDGMKSTAKKNIWQIHETKLNYIETIIRLDSIMRLKIKQKQRKKKEIKNIFYSKAIRKKNSLLENDNTVSFYIPMA